MGKILSTQQAVEEFFNNTISQEFLYQLVREKRVPCVKLGARILFDEDKLTEWWREELEKSTHGIRKIREGR
jgi:excisionase family DNA binding protein